MKTINVAAAVIFRISDSGAKEVFAVQRGYGEFKGWWEFPGGKIETGETPQQALAREIKEELDAEISVGECIGTVEYDYPAFHLSMQCFSCTLVPGQKAPSLLEHENADWLNAETLKTVKWLPADLIILDKISAML